MIQVCIPREDLDELYNRIAHYQRMIEMAREALQYAISMYGKPGGPWNVPGDPGGWLDRARKVLAALETAKMEGE